MKIAKATEQYEKWLGSQIRLDSKDLNHKHDAMAADPFSFLRATFYRWIQIWPDVCASLTSAPEVLSVADLHVENFGTWRDHEGRLIWGVNDFDEAFHLPYTHDLTRLAASANLAIDRGALRISAVDACQAILDGYQSAVKIGGEAFVLGEAHEWLWRLATSQLRNPVPFWKKLQSFQVATKVPEKTREQLLKRLPDAGMKVKFLRRIAGLGSLGRERYAAVGEWSGGLIARESKALAASAVCWAWGVKERKPLYNEIVKGAIRCADPFVEESKSFVYRRLAPDCSRIDLEKLPRARDEARLLNAMGRELANVHVGTRQATTRVLADLAKQKRHWLYNAADAMAIAVKQDWQDWRHFNASAAQRLPAAKSKPRK